MKTAEQTEHTPGPWNAVITERGMAAINGGPSTLQNGEPYQVGWVIIEEKNKEARKVDIANARLIALAPELLGALQGLIETGQRYDDVPEVAEWAAFKDALDLAIGTVAKVK